MLVAIESNLFESWREITYYYRLTAGRRTPWTHKRTRCTVETFIRNWTELNYHKTRLLEVVPRLDAELLDVYTNSLPLSNQARCLDFSVTRIPVRAASQSPLPFLRLVVAVVPSLKLLVFVDLLIPLLAWRSIFVLCCSGSPELNYLHYHRRKGFVESTERM